MSRQLHTFEPVFDERSRVLILGSFPSVKSRAEGFYYGHPRNRFWQVTARLFDEPIPASADEKCALLLRHHIALWDVCAACEIEGSADAAIRDVVPNDLSALLNRAPIRRIFTNGATAHRLYERLLQPATGIPATRLPSTSPANAAASLDALLKAWAAIRESEA